MPGVRGAAEPLFEQPVVSVTELTVRIKQALETNIGHVWVTGEISGFLRHRDSGHCYFSLKDEGAVVKAVMFRFQARNLKFDPEEGLEVVAFGRVSVYEKRGAYQLYVEHMQPKGMGILQLRFEQLKKKLEAEGLFEEGRKRPLPYLPRSVGIVTSAGSAAVRDMVETIHKRFPARIFVHDVRVQGEGAAKEIAAAIRDLPRRAPEIDVMIVGRGGGSIEDLWAFNEEPVVRAIAASKVPVVSAVGHETDVTLADFAADERAKTPTDAGAMVVPILEELVRMLETAGTRLEGYLRDAMEHAWLTVDRYSDSYGLRAVETLGERWGEHIRGLEERAARALQEGVRRKKEGLGALAERNVFRNSEVVLAGYRQALSELASKAALVIPERRAELARMQLGNLAQRLEGLAEARVKELRQRLDALSQQLSGLDPKKVLERGYSITEQDGRIIRTAAEVPPGKEIVTTLWKGKLRSITRS